MQETPNPCYIMEAPDGDRHQLGFGLERVSSQCWREVSAVFRSAASCSTVLGHTDRKHLRFGIVQESQCQMIVGKGSCAHSQPGRVLERSGWSTSQQCRLTAGPADEEQERGSMQCSLAAGQHHGGCWMRLLLRASISGLCKEARYR